MQLEIRKTLTLIKLMKMIIITKVFDKNKEQQ